MRRRRLKRRLFWASVLAGLLLLALVGTVVQAGVALARAPSRLTSRLGGTPTTEKRQPMRRLIPFGALMLVLGIAVGGGTLASASSTASAQTMTLIAVDVPKSDIYVNVGSKGDGPGDTNLFREALLRDGKRVGVTEIMCTAMSRSAARCWGTMRLPGGTLEAAGAIHFARSFSVPVLGGTGTYRGASGELTVTPLGEKRDRYEIELAG
jgi:hypothetical protein